MSTDLIFLLIVVARVLLGGAFFVAGLRNVRSIGILTQMMGANGMPLPRLSVPIGVGLQIVCGAALALGFLPAYAAAGLALFVLVATLVVHRFWAYQGEERFSHVNAFISNTALFGAFLFVLAASL